MAETRAGQVIDALVALTRALPGWRGYQDYTDDQDMVTVFDGPEFTGTEDYSSGALLIIGWNGDDEGQRFAAETEVAAGPIAASVRPRDEVGTVHCLAVGQQAETPKLARDAAHAVIQGVSALCRATPALGIDTSSTIGGVRTFALVSAGNLTQYSLNGFNAEWEFNVRYSTRV